MHKRKMATKRTIVQVNIDIKDLIPQFMKNRRLDLLELEVLLEQKDFEKIARLAHKIKGTAGGYGFSQLSTLASELELAVKKEDEAALKNVIGTMKDHFFKIEVQFV